MSVLGTVKSKKFKLLMLAVTGFTSIFLLLLASICIGPAEINWTEALSIIIRKINGVSIKDSAEIIVINLRLPRFIEAVMIGSSLSIAGAYMQALVRNPLVDPYILGVASGAAFGASLTFVVGLPFTLMFLPISAFIGALIAFIITLVLAEMAGGTPLSIVLSGIAVSTGFSAAVTLLLFFSEEKTHGLLLWLFGSLTLSSWREVAVLTPVFLFGVIFSLLEARALNCLLMGEEQAIQLGINVRKLKIAILMVSSLLTAIPVSFAGIIGFVGLIAPHIARMTVGGDHRLMLPAALIFGSLILTSADLAAKSLVMPIELPIGSLTAAIGTPFFIYLLLKTRGKYVL